MSDVVAYVVTAILGGGFFKATESLFRAITESKEKKALSDAVGAKTPVEIESVSVATMTTALQSSQSRIKFLEDEREKDNRYYQDRITQLEKERTEDRLFYQERIKELNDQLIHVRAEMASMEKKIADLLAETQLEGGET